MRQIIPHNTWSGNPNGSVRGGSSLSLQSLEDSSTGRGETDSSFEVANSSANYADRSSKGKPRTQQTAMHPASSDRRIGQQTFVSAAETSWDAITNDPVSMKASAKSVVTPSPPSRTSMGRTRTFLNKSKATTAPVTTDNSRSGSKIARLASMFTSRAVPVVVPIRASSPEGDDEKDLPSSPPRSETSTTYVGWPGTQDKEGVTVVAESSYEESESSAGGARRPGHDQDKIHRLADRKLTGTRDQIFMEPYEDDSMSDLSSPYSRTSSAYFNPGEVQAIRNGNTEQLALNRNKNRMAAATVMRRCLSSSKAARQQQPQALTEEALAMKDHFSPPTRAFNNPASTGYRGLLDKTQDVPNLMDETASDTTSTLSAATSRHSSSSPTQSRSTSHYRSRRQKHQQLQHRVTTIDEEEDDPKREEMDAAWEGYDGSDRIVRANVSSLDSEDAVPEGILGAASRATMNKLNLALLGGGLTTIQTTTDDFANRITASDFDETLSTSDYDQDGFVRIPNFEEMVSAGRSHHDRTLSCQSLQFASSGRPKNPNQKRLPGNDRLASLISLDSTPRRDFDFSQYYIESQQMQILVKKFRKMSLARCQRFDYEELDREEDATKAFALSEMRSRIMETDIERGLERQGGTTVVDDIVLTSYHKAALRVRDAVIVAKAWRDGATPHDVVLTSNLTRRDERSYFIPRLQASMNGRPRCRWEEVCWLDDNELSRYRCHSIGPRDLKGVEMFTIGDCQSILLKLSFERCQELRGHLNNATAVQIEAEAAMKLEGETSDGMMTEAEMTYLTSMEEVKSLSQQLVLAEKSFALVKNRIERLVAKYEALLVHFENETESVAPSSVFSYESSCYTEDYGEDEVLARRAKRAELRAELVARESMLANQIVSKSVRMEKEKEVSKLKARISDLQSESSAAITDRDRSVVLARAIARTNSGGVTRGASTQSNDRSKIDDIKQRFRDRSAAKLQFQSRNKPVGGNMKSQSNSQNRLPGKNQETSNFHRTVGEEMFQHLDFYERSLKAVERPR